MGDRDWDLGLGYGNGDWRLRIEDWNLVIRAAMIAAAVMTSIINLRIFEMKQ